MVEVIVHKDGCYPDPTEDPYHGCECGTVGGNPHGAFAPKTPEVKSSGEMEE